MLVPGTSTVQPVREQQRAVDLFLAGGNLRIDACAGTGKTTTLRLLAESKPGRGLYLAFNRAIALEAQQRFPAHVKCATTYSVAAGVCAGRLAIRSGSLRSQLTPHLILCGVARSVLVATRPVVNLLSCLKPFKGVA